MKFELKLFLLVIAFPLSFIGLGQNGSINQTDENNKKQGHWVFTNKQKRLPGYKPDQVVEEGDYENNRKVGDWTFYFNNGNIKHVLTYHNNMPNGPAIFYYKNGNVREKGTWKNNRWIGEYLQFYPNGNIKNEFNYNNQGVKDGEQKYYHENGNLQILGKWANGEETTEMFEYNVDGSPNTTRYKAGPSISSFQTKKQVQPNTPPPKLDEKPEVVAVAETVSEVKDSVIRKAEKKPVKRVPFDGNGYHEFKDRQGRNIRVGQFENGYLVKGKTFEYDKKGNVKITKIIEDGKVIKVIKSEESKTK